MQELIFYPTYFLLSIFSLIPQVTSTLKPPHIDRPAEYISSPVTITVTPKLMPIPTPDTRPWGIAEQKTEHTWVIRINNDPTMANSDEILKALNDLRSRHGSQPLKTDSRLCDYAQKRADYFKTIQNTDEHKGIKDFLSDENNYGVLGYNWIGENSSYGYIMTGVHLIEFVYNADPDHSKNQLDPKWDHACVGVNTPATNIIFATAPR